MSSLSTITRALANDLLIAHIATKIFKIKPKTPFTHLKGKAEEKTLPKDGEVSIFSANVCAINGGGSLIGGGVIDWNRKTTWGKNSKDTDTRLSKITDKIVENDPDVICLQEVNSVDAAYFLYNKLKEKYAHFYINIGPQFFSQNSGLFIASKYKIENPNFQNFPKGKGFQKIVNKGVFDFKICNKDKNAPLLHIFTTHLAPVEKDNYDFDVAIRKKSMNIIKNRIKNPPSCPVILAGDMNTQWSKEEKSEYQQNFKNFKNLAFKDTHNNQFFELKEGKHTCNTENQKNYWANKKLTKNPKETVLDYIFLLTHIDDNELKTTIIPQNSEIIKLINSENPKYSVSDHNALYLEFKFFTSTC